MTTCRHVLEIRYGLGRDAELNSFACEVCGRLWEAAEVVEREGVTGLLLPGNRFIAYDDLPLA